MTNYEKLVRKPSFFRMFTGLSVGEFDALLADLEPVWLARSQGEAIGEPTAATQALSRPQGKAPVG